MVFWLAVLVGALFAWIAVRIGFYATWILFFHVVLAAYVAIFLAPTLIVSVPAATAIPGYGYALTLMSIAIATLFLAYGTCYACLSGKLRIEFPRFFDTIVAGLLGFLAGFLVWSFLTFSFSLTPLAEFEVFKKLGFDAQSQESNTSYVCWWCDGLHSLVSPFGDETTGQQAVAELLKKAAPPAAKETKPGAAPAAPPPPAPPAPLPNTTAGPDADKVPAREKEGPAGGRDERESEHQSAAGPRRPRPGPRAEPPRPPSESLEEELSRRHRMIDSPNAVRAAVADQDVRIIEVADTCGADRFDAAQTVLLQNWVFNGGVLWANNSALSFFGVHYSKLAPADDELDCAVSEAVEVSPIVAECKRVALGSAGGKANILVSKAAMPLLVLDRDTAKHKAGTACWSLVPYGKGWISDAKPVDTTQYDGTQFWQNFCRFCLGKESLETPSAEAAPSSDRKPKPPAAPRGPLSGAWQASSGAQFHIDDDGKTVTIDLLASDVLKSLTGRLVRRDEQSFTGIVDAIFKADPFKRHAIDVTVTIADPRHLRLRCVNWPKWNKQGKLLTKNSALDEVWTRSDAEGDRR